MMRRLTSSSFAGTSRTDVAVGTASERSMFSTMRAPVPRRRRGLGTVGVDGCDRGRETPSGRRATGAVRAVRRMTVRPVRAVAAGTEVRLPVRGHGGRVGEETFLHLRDQPGVDRGAGGTGRRVGRRHWAARRHRCRGDTGSGCGRVRPGAVLPGSLAPRRVVRRRDLVPSPPSRHRSHRPLRPPRPTGVASPDGHQ